MSTIYFIFWLTNFIIFFTKLIHVCINFHIFY
nr:MAG TPA: hypothetical protein [Caudoviricetes sp.]